MPGRSQEEALGQCAQAIVESVPRTMRFVRTEMRRGSPALSVPQFRTLAFLGRQAGASLSALAHHLGVTPPTVSALVDRLVREGLVDRAVDPFERRRSVLTLTAAGLDFLRAAHENTRQRVEEALDRLTTEELEAVTRAMSLLGTVFGEVTKRG